MWWYTNMINEFQAACAALKDYFNNMRRDFENGAVINNSIFAKFIRKITWPFINIQSMFAGYLTIPLLLLSFFVTPYIFGIFLFPYVLYTATFFPLKTLLLAPFKLAWNVMKSLFSIAAWAISHPAATIAIAAVVTLFVCLNVFVFAPLGVSFVVGFLATFAACYVAAKTIDLMATAVKYVAPVFEAVKHDKKTNDTINLVLSDREITYNEYMEKIKSNDQLFFVLNVLFRAGSISLKDGAITQQQADDLMSALGDVSFNPFSMFNAPPIFILNLRNNKLQALAIPDKLNYLALIDVNKNELKVLKFPAELLWIEEVYADYNKLPSLYLPTGQLQHLRFLNIAFNPLTPVTKFFVTKIPARAPNVEITGNNAGNQVLALSDQALQDHTKAVIATYLQVPRHLKSFNYLLNNQTLWVFAWPNQDKIGDPTVNRTQLHNLPRDIQTRIMSYLTVYPISAHETFKMLEDEIENINKFTVQEENRAEIEKFLTQFNLVKVKLREDLQIRTNTRFTDTMNGRFGRLAQQTGVIAQEISIPQTNTNPTVGVNMRTLFEDTVTTHFKNTL